MKKKYILFLVLYFTVQTLLRTITSPVADLDDSEQLLFAQAWHFGYGPDPPLYNWLQHIFLDILGVSIGGIAVFRNILLFCLFVVTFWSALQVFEEEDLALVTSVVLFFIPQFGWESQRMLTHTVLASTLAITTLGLWFYVLKTKSIVSFVLLGLVCGLGIISKFSYLFFLTGLLGAGLLIEKTRCIIFSKGFLIATAVCILVIGPVLIWMSQNPMLSFASVNKFQMSQGISWGKAIIRSITKTGSVIVIQSFGLIVPGLIVAWKSRTGLDKRGILNELSSGLLIYGAIITFVLVTVVSILFKVTSFRERWFQPMLVWLPFLFVVVVRRHLDINNVRWILVLGSIVAAGYALVMVGRVWLADFLQKPVRLNTPFGELAKRIKNTNSVPDVLICGDVWLGGNMRLYYPNVPIITPQYPDYSIIPEKGSAKIVCLIDQYQSLAPALDYILTNLAELRFDIETNSIAIITLKYQNSQKLVSAVANANFEMQKPERGLSSNKNGKN